MKKNLTYRDKLLELSRIYKITEIQNYIKRKKNLTTHQIEHILKKNNVPIPKDFNISFFKKSISNPISKAGKEVTGLYSDTTDGVEKFFKRKKREATGLLDNTTGGVESFLSKSWRKAGNIGIGILNTFPKLISTVIDFVSNTFVEIFSSFYTSKVEESKTNRLVRNFAIGVFICAIGIVFFTVKENYEKENVNFVQIKKEPKEKIKLDKKLKAKKETKDQIKKKLDTNKKEKEKKTTEKIVPKKEKSPSQVTELVLPNLNIKTETVLSLFEDVEYDLKTVRYKKTVKPIYFTQFPKDLDEIKDTQLKKETFIKIVLPLVVAENEKILNDKNKLRKIISKKMTNDKEKSWLRLKLREYKVKNSNMKELEMRMDIIPASIALAQAAKESGWGTSRFALEGNAIFGQWTWTGQGIEPLNKGKHEGHKILRFPILRASVKAYQNNLNTHKGYSEFREKRFTLRKRNKSIRGLDLTDTLEKYAQTGKEYTEILEQIIKQNNLADFETVQLTNSVVKKDIQL